MSVGKSGLKHIFVYSLPRSGSTLLQRALSSSNKIKTMSENWFFINELLVLEEYLSVSEVGFKDIKKGQMDLVAKVSKQEYLLSIKAKYEYLCECLLRDEGGVEYVLDKTPRNLIFHQHIVKIYGDQKFIYLVRHPFSIATSMLDTWCNGKWYIDEFDIDFNKGVKAILEGFHKYGSHENYVFLKYEDLVSSPDEKINMVRDFLGGDAFGFMEKSGLPEVKGSLGDKTGVKKYKNISTQSVGSSENFCSSYIRYNWARKYYSANRSFFDQFGYHGPVNGQVGLGYLARTIKDFYDLLVYKAIKALNLNLVGLSALAKGKLR